MGIKLILLCQITIFIILAATPLEALEGMGESTLNYFYLGGELISLNNYKQLPWSYRKFHWKGEPYQFRGKRDSSLFHRQTSCYFYIE